MGTYVWVKMERSSILNSSIGSMWIVRENGSARLFAPGNKNQHNRQNSPDLQLHPNSWHVHEAVRDATLPICPPGRLHVHQEAWQNRRWVQWPLQWGIHFHVVLQGWRVRPQLDRCQSLGHVRSRLESSQWWPSYGARLERWTEKAMLCKLLVWALFLFGNYFSVVQKSVFFGAEILVNWHYSYSFLVYIILY